MHGIVLLTAPPVFKCPAEAICRHGAGWTRIPVGCEIVRVEDDMVFLSESSRSTGGVSSICSILDVGSRSIIICQGQQSIFQTDSRLTFVRSTAATSYPAQPELSLTSPRQAPGVSEEPRGLHTACKPPNPKIPGEHWGGAAPVQCRTRAESSFLWLKV